MGVKWTGKHVESVFGLLDDKALHFEMAQSIPFEAYCF
jgi:hypothetical protein